MADDAPGGSPDQPAPPPADGFPAGAHPAAPTIPVTSTGAEPTTAFAGPDPRPTTAFAGPDPGPTAIPGATEERTTAISGAEPTAPFAEAPALTSAAPTDQAAPAVTPNGRRTGWRRWLPLVGVITFIALCSVAMLLILGFSNGIAGLLIGLGAAILPVPVLVGCFLWLDRYEPEPTRYLVFCFAWGASVATLVALGVNTGGAYLFDRLGLPDALVAVLIAPFIEETMKALGPILLLWRRRREWSGITDGIVYCGLAAIGFAMVENVLYLGGHGYAAGADQYGPATGIQNVFLIFIVRILFTGFAHPLFTSMAGVGLGLASRSGDRRVKWLAPIAGLLVAMILHGLFNLLPTLSVATGETLIMLYGYLGFMVPFFFLTVGFAIALRAWEGRLSERVLPHYVRTGWLSPPEVAALGNLGRRHSARRWAKRVAGPDGLKAMRGFQFAATQLAILRDGMQRGLDRKPKDVEQSAAEEQRLLGAISTYRSAFVGRDPQMPPAFWDGNRYRIAFPDGVTRAVDAPSEPVMPLPVRLAQPVPVGAGAGYGLPPAPPAFGYGPPPAQWYGPGYGVPPTSGPAYGAPPTSSPAYGAPPTSGLAYGAPPSSGPAYGAPPSGLAYGAPPSGPAYGAPPSSGAYGAPPASGYQPGPSYQAQPVYPQPTYPQPGYEQPGYQQAGYQQPGYQQAGYQQPGYQQAGYQQPGYQQAGYQQPGHPQSGYQQPGSQPTGYERPAFPQPGNPAPTPHPDTAQPSHSPQPSHPPQPDHGAPPAAGTHAPPPAEAPERPRPENPPPN